MRLPGASLTSRSRTSTAAAAIAVANGSVDGPAGGGCCARAVSGRSAAPTSSATARVGFAAMARRLVLRLDRELLEQPCGRVVDPFDPLLEGVLLVDLRDDRAAPDRPLGGSVHDVDEHGPLFMHARRSAGRARRRSASGCSRRLAPRW